MGKSSGNVMCDGTIDTSKIYDTHRQVKEIVESFKEVNRDVSEITATIKENWVGKGRMGLNSRPAFTVLK